MIYGIIDLGANTVRLNMYNFENNNITKIFSKKEILGLAAYVTDGILSQEGMLKAIETLNSFKDLAVKFIDVSQLYVFATASLRNIHNRAEAVQTITDATSLPIEILSEDDEASMGFIGIKQSINLQDGILIDIGGASTEFVQIQDYKPTKIVSLPIGCLNLYLNNVQNLVPTANERNNIKHQIKSHLSTIDWHINPNPATMVGIGGTIRATLKLSNNILNQNNKDTLTNNTIKELHSLIKKSDTNNKFVHHAIYKTVPERALTIFTGLSILKASVKKFNVGTVVVSQYGVREGYLIDRVLCKGN